MTDAEDALFGIDKLNVSRSDRTRGDACRLLGPRANRARETNPRYHELIAVSTQITGCP